MSAVDEDRIVEDHSICCDVVVSAGVRHVCNEWKGHLGTHECGCGKYWLNTVLPLQE